MASLTSERSQARDYRSANQIRRPIGQMIITGFSGSDAKAPDFQRALNNLKGGIIGGVLFLGHNVGSREELQTMIKMIQNCKCKAVPFIAIDEEGGVVERLGEDIGFKSISSPAELEHSGLLAAKIQYKRLARKLSSLGFNLNLAPVVDLNTNPDNPIIGARDRSYSSNPKVVANFARTFIAEHHALKILTSLKHFPGHGSSIKDSHIAIADVSTTWKDAELYPYRYLIRAHLVDTIMVGHLRNIPRWGGTASQEGSAIKILLRKQLKFTGVTISDDLGMGAVSTSDTRPFANVITSAIKTGVDIVLVAHRINSDTGRYVNAAILDGLGSGTLSTREIKRSLRRIKKLKQTMSAKR